MIRCLHILLLAGIVVAVGSPLMGQYCSHRIRIRLLDEAGKPYMVSFKKGSRQKGMIKHSKLPYKVSSLSPEGKKTALLGTSSGESEILLNIGCGQESNLILCNKAKDKMEIHFREACPRSFTLDIQFRPGVFRIELCPEGKDLTDLSPANWEEIRVQPEK